MSDGIGFGANELSPLEIVDARAALRHASEAQRDLEASMRQASDDHADAERIYRLALAKCIVEKHAGGAAWTVSQDLARGEPSVAALRYERDVKKGVLGALEQQAFRYAADRRGLEKLIEWSMRRELAAPGTGA